MTAMHESPRLTSDEQRGRLAASDLRLPSLAPATRRGQRLFGRGACLKELDAATRIVVGNAGDHALVLRLLVEIYQCPLAEDFQSRLDEPAYEPSDRLLLVRDGRLVGHVQVSKYFGWFHEQRCPLVKLQDFVTLPEFRAGEYEQTLLRVAEATALREGSILGLVRTDRPEWFEQHGWTRFWGQGYTQANTRAILSHFDAQWANPRRRKPAIEVRTWRHFELDSLRRLYQQVATNMWGPLHRSEQAWQWLVNRKAQDQVLLAVERQRDQPDAEPSQPLVGDDPHVVGYAVVRDSCIVEMFTLPGYATARPMMVARACRDAIDRDHHFVSLHTPASEAMHEVLVTAGGTWVADSPTSGGVWMLKLLAPDRWVERCYPILHQRAREAGLHSAQQIDLAVGQTDYRLILTRRSSRLEPITRRQPQAQCDWHTFQNLLTSNLAVPEALDRGQLRTDYPSVSHALAALFPPKLFWQSPFELLRV